MNRQKLILFILLILLALAVIWAYLKRPQLKAVSSLKYPPGAHLRADKRREPVVARFSSLSGSRTLRLDLLNREKPVFSGYRRNIFKPVFVNELAAMKQRATANLPTFSQPVQLPATAQPAVGANAVTEPIRELARFTFLGFISKNAVKTIFLAKEQEKDKDREILLVKKGDNFGGGRFEAMALTEQALTIRIIDTGDEIVVPLIENRSLLAVQR